MQQHNLTIKKEDYLNLKSHPFITNNFKSMIISQCNFLESLEGMENLKIENLVINLCNNLKSLKGIKQVEKNLDIGNINYLNFDLELKNDLPFLTLNNIEKINFQNNKTKYIEEIKLLDVFIDDFDNFPSFKYFYSYNSNFDNFEGLNLSNKPEYIYIKYNQQLQNIKGLKQVKGLNIECCDNITELNFNTEIESLTLKSLNNLIKADLRNIQNLKNIYLERLPKLIELYLPDEINVLKIEYIENFDFEWLKNKKINKLIIYDNKIDNKNFEKILKVKELNEIELSGLNNEFEFQPLLLFEKIPNVIYYETPIDTKPKIRDKYEKFIAIKELIKFFDLNERKKIINEIFSE